MRTRKIQRLGKAFETSAMLVGVLGLVWALTLVLPELRGLGIWPRTMRGLVGILAAPLLHANLAHLTANALPLLVLLTLLFWDKHYHPERTLALVWLAAGLGTWLIGRGHAVHIGASGLVYGLVTYLVVSGFLMKSWRSAFVALLVFLFYGGIVYGMLPQRGLISWEGHLCGALAGLWAARRNHTR